MTQAARRRRTQPTLTPPPEPPGPPAPSDEVAREGEDRDKGEGSEWVTCFLSGEKISKQQAVLARIGPGRSMWIARTLTAEGAPDPRPTWR